MQSRDINFDPEANTNIDDISVVPLSDRLSPLAGGTSFITIPEGVTEASFVVTPFVDNFVEPDETISVDLIPQEDYTVNAENSFADLVITEGIPQITGTDAADDLQGTDNAEIISGLEGNDTLAGESGDDILVGGIGSDILTGGKGTDRLIGVDPLNFYDDGDAATAGTDDYALIADFGIEEDKIELIGEASSYFLGAFPENLPSGTGIYLNDGESPELIAIVADVSSDLLGLDNSSQFTFVEI